jgi:uncharacterized protein (TIGR02246 family)
MKKLTYVLVALFISSNVYAMAGNSTGDCVKVNQSEIASLFDRWNNSLQTGRPSEVVKNYASDAVLLPTVSNKPRTNHALIEDYFVMFLKKSPKGVINDRTIRIGCNAASDVGVYTFTLNGTDKVQARYSYNYEYINGKWLITHHHSSAMPEKI